MRTLFQCQRGLASGVSLLCAAVFFAGNLPAEDRAGVETEVASIRQYYVEVEALQDLQKLDLVFKCDGEPMEGVLTRRAKSTGQVVRIDLGYLEGGHGGADEMYYYRDGQVFFVLVSASWWQFSGKKEGETIDTMRERRYYFSKGKCIRILEKKVTAPKQEQLRALISKAENRELDLNTEESKEVIAEVRRKADVLPRLEDSKAVAKFFCEGE
ncbi:MAG: hypothetical protein L3J39_09710 [Verrucomicrobiales bacterium]|nr:hypothetical protein [Verrucomicrobiales bacterium]